MVILKKRLINSIVLSLFILFTWGWQPDMAKELPAEDISFAMSMEELLNVDITTPSIKLESLGVNTRDYKDRLISLPWAIPQNKVG